MLSPLVIFVFIVFLTAQSRKVSEVFCLCFYYVIFQLLQHIGIETSMFVTKVCCVLDCDDLYMWGWNESGQLAIPYPDKDSVTSDGVAVAPLPRLVDSLDCILSASCGSRHTAALTRNMRLFLLRLFECSCHYFAALLKIFYASLYTLLPFIRLCPLVHVQHLWITVSGCFFW